MNAPPPEVPRPEPSRDPFDTGIIGAGRVGAVLGAALVRSGHRVTAVSGRSAASRARIARLLPESPIRTPEQVAAGADLLILAVPDDALGPLVAGLVASDAIRAGQIVAHTSGAHGLAVLDPIAARGGRPLALHPAMTFAGTPADIELLLAGTAFGVTAPTSLVPVVTRLVGELGGTVEWIPEEDRPLYHAALAHGANHLVTLVNDAADRLRDAGALHPERLLRPLLTVALDNALRLGDAALTGPVARGDAGTVTAHLAALRSSAPRAVEPYVVLARRTADRAVAAGALRPGDAERVLRVLAAEPVGQVPA